MIAVISDLHSNLEALTAVLADIEETDAEEIVCLGDVVGYGPDPIAVTDLVMERARVTIKGNHDEALVMAPFAIGFNPSARRAIEWTRDLMKPGFFSGAAVRRRWDFLAGLPLRHEVEGVQFVHGSPRDPTSEYVLGAELVFGFSDKYEEIFASFDRLLLVGHTHLPCVITDEGDVRSPSQLGGEYVHRGGKAIVNVGSVGQPRDHDPRASYVLLDGDRVTWRRVEYDRDATREKIAAIPELDNRLAERLAVGQ